MVESMRGPKSSQPGLGMSIFKILDTQFKGRRRGNTCGARAFVDLPTHTPAGAPESSPHTIASEKVQFPTVGGRCIDNDRPPRTHAYHASSRTSVTLYALTGEFGPGHLPAVYAASLSRTGARVCMKGEHHEVINEMKTARARTSRAHTSIRGRENLLLNKMEAEET